MLNTKFLDEMAEKMSEVIEKSPAKDIEKNARALLMQGFSRLDLVTREEFEVQAEMLNKARSQLSALETKVSELERQLGRQASSPASEKE